MLTVRLALLSRLFLIVACIAGGSGCAGLESFNPDSARAARDRAAAASEALASDAADRERLAASLGAEDPLRQRLEQEAAQARASKAALDAAIGQVDVVLNEAAAPTNPISAGAAAVAPFLPPPLGGTLLLGGALAATLLRAGQLKAALRSVAKSLESAMGDDADLRKKFQEHAATVRSIQTPTAQAVVDQVQEGYRFVLPI